jgi:hypothetical protein
MTYLPEVGYYVGWSKSIQSVFTSDTKREVWNIHVGPPKYPYTNVVHGGGKFVVAGEGIVYWSTNLAGWSVSDIPLNSNYKFSGLSYSEGLKRFVITASNGTGLYVYQSDNAAQWFSRTQWVTDRQINKIVSSDVVYALGQTGMVLFSVDAVQWQLLSGNFWNTVLWATPSTSGYWFAPQASRDGPTDKTVPLFVTSDGIVWNRTSTNTSAIVLGFSGPPLRAKKIIDVPGP